MRMETDSLLKLCDIDAIPDDGILRVEPAGLPPLAVYKIGGAVYVTDDTCTHGEASLADGEIDPDCCAIVCPYHLGSFDIRTGEPMAAPCTDPLKIYPVVLRDGAVFIEVAA